MTVNLSLGISILFNMFMIINCFFLFFQEIQNHPLWNPENQKCLTPWPAESKVRTPFLYFKVLTKFPLEIKISIIKLQYLVSAFVVGNKLYGTKVKTNCGNTMSWYTSWSSFCVILISSKYPQNVRTEMVLELKWFHGT